MDNIKSPIRRIKEISRKLKRLLMDFDRNGADSSFESNIIIMLEEEVSILEKKIEDKKCNGNILRSFADAFNSFALIYEKRQNWENMLNNLNKTSDAYAKLVSKCPESVEYKIKLSEYLLWIGLRYYSSEEWPQSLRYYNQAVDYLSELIKKVPGNAKVILDISVGYAQLGRLSKIKDDHKEALIYFKKSLNFLENLVKAEPENIRYNKILAKIFNDIGLFYEDMSELKETVKYYLKELDIREWLVNESPKDDRMVKDLSLAYYNLGVIYIELNDFYNGSKYLDKCQELSQKLLLKEPFSREYQFLIYEAIAQTGLAHKKNKNWKQSLEFLLEARDILRELMNFEEGNEEYLAHYANVCADLAGLFYKLNNLDKALHYLNEGVTTFNSLLEKEIKRDEIIFALANLYETIAGLYFIWDDLTVAMDFCNKCQAIAEELVYKDSDNVAYLTILFDSYFLINLLYREIGDNIKEKEYELKLKKLTDEKNSIIRDEMEKAVQSLVHRLKRKKEKIKREKSEIHALGYRLPESKILKDHSDAYLDVSDEEIIKNKNIIVEAFGELKIGIKRIRATIGSTILLFEIFPAPGIPLPKLKKRIGKTAAIFYQLNARISRSGSGVNTIQIEIPNRKPRLITLQSVINSISYPESGDELHIALGRTIKNDPFSLNLLQASKILVAGDSPEEKNRVLNVFIASILFRKYPSQVKFVFIDTNKDLSYWAPIQKHFFQELPFIEDMMISGAEKAVLALSSLVSEAYRRVEILNVSHSINIKDYNESIRKNETNVDGSLYLPYIIVVISEYTDLLKAAGDRFEMPLAHIAQLAMNVGIFLIIATSKPSKKTITTIVNANFNTRVVLRIFSKADSVAVLDADDATTLTGDGDMLLSSKGETIRIQCPFIDIPEIEMLAKTIGSQEIQEMGDK